MLHTITIILLFLAGVFYSFAFFLDYAVDVRVAFGIICAGLAVTLTKKEPKP